MTARRTNPFGVPLVDHVEARANAGRKIRGRVAAAAIRTFGLHTRSFFDPAKLRLRTEEVKQRQPVRVLDECDRALVAGTSM
jgi:hypothetical protein